MSDDALTGIPSLVVDGRNRVAGLGPELVLPIASKKAVYGFVTARYQWEMGARTTTQGDGFNLTFVFPLKPIQINS